MPWPWWMCRTRSRVLGFVPAGWYPTAVRALADGRLVVVNGKGLGTGPTGTASFVDPFGAEELEAYTKTVLENSPYRDSDPYDAGGGSGQSRPHRECRLRHPGGQ